MFPKLVSNNKLCFFFDELSGNIFIILLNNIKTSSLIDTVDWLTFFTRRKEYLPAKRSTFPPSVPGHCCLCSLSVSRLSAHWVSSIFTVDGSSSGLKETTGGIDQHQATRISFWWDVCAVMVWRGRAGRGNKTGGGYKTIRTSMGTKQHICAKVISKFTVTAHSFCALFCPELLQRPTPRNGACFGLPLPQDAIISNLSPLPLCLSVADGHCVWQQGHWVTSTWGRALLLWVSFDLLHAHTCICGLLLMCTFVLLSDFHCVFL